MKGFIWDFNVSIDGISLGCVNRFILSYLDEYTLNDMKIKIKIVKSMEYHLVSLNYV